ncbi:hypothetical protein ACFY9A_37830 [Streptomyces rubradiris]|uniref:hypothetical protein n=1 Tax=Streptomyces rubradiris TaxID=285531 RepID=UPI0036E77AC3
MSTASAPSFPDEPTSEAMVRLMYGTDSAEVRRREEAGQLNAGSNEAVLCRLLERVGVSRLLAPGEDLMTADGQLKRVLRLSDCQDHDLLQLVPWLLRHKVAEDRAYETDSGRAPQVTTARGLEPGDAALLRHRSVSPAALNPPALAEDIQGGALTQVYLLMSLMATYTAWPHFIPASAAFDAATGLPPEPEAELRLPAETVLVFHDGIPLPAVTADDADLHAHATARFSAMTDGAGDPLFTREPLIVGGVLMGHPDGGTEGDHLLNEELGWLLMARRADDGTNHFFQMPVTHLENTAPAARILRNYAGLLALEGWDVPPPMPGRARPNGKGKKSRTPSPAERRRRAQTPQARAGALLRVRSLTAPPHRPAPPPRPTGPPSRPRRLTQQAGLRPSTGTGAARTSAATPADTSSTPKAAPCWTNTAGPPARSTGPTPSKASPSPGAEPGSAAPGSTNTSPHAPAPRPYTRSTRALPAPLRIRADAPVPPQPVRGDGGRTPGPRRRASPARRPGGPPGRHRQELRREQPIQTGGRRGGRPGARVLRAAAPARRPAPSVDSRA